MTTIESLDDAFLISVTDKTVVSLGKFKYKSCIEWRGETDQDEYFIIRYGAGFIAVGIGLTEYSAEMGLSVTGSVSTGRWFLDKTKIPTICDILQFLNWSLVDDEVYFE